MNFGVPEILLSISFFIPFLKGIVLVAVLFFVYRIHQQVKAIAEKLDK